MILVLLPLSLIFDESRPWQELHVAAILGTMEALHYLELLDVRITGCFYTVFTERVHFRFERFACKSPLFDPLLHFLFTQ